MTACPLPAPAADPAAQAGLEPARIRRARRNLLRHYARHQRDLPWRRTRDPYAIWISEVMLQQTRVDTVIPDYRRWLERFPNVEALAKAKEDEVLRVWQGLGYYSRARRLHQGARVVRERHGGVLPGSSQELRGLPGVGEYTAGAVASIAFGEVVPAVDGNVKRVLSRLFDLPSATPGEFRALARELVDPERPGDFNQALMELGALVCTPRPPRCGECPISSECLALRRGTAAERPVPKIKKPIPEVDVAVLVVVAKDEDGGLWLLLRKRPPTGLLAGMWEFPGVEVTNEPSKLASASNGDRLACSFRDAAIKLAVGLGLDFPRLTLGFTLGTRSKSEVPGLKVVTHVFSHLKARYRPFLVPLSRPSLPDFNWKSTRWIPAQNLSDVPLPVAQSKIAQLALSFMTE